MPNPRIPEGSAAAGEFDSDDGDDDFRRNRNYTPASSSVDNLEYKDLSRNFSSVRAMVVDGQQDEIHHQSEHRNDREHQQQQYYQHRQYQGHSRGHSHDGRYYGYNNNNVGGSGHPGGAENLHQGVAAALGLHDQHLGTAARLNETSKYSVMHPPTMSDATMRADSSHQPVYRSTGMIRGPRTPSSLGGDGGDSIPPFPPRPMTTTTMPENNTAATSHGSAATFASISHVSSVHALPINGASTASTYRMPSFAGEPPMTQAVPVPAGDQPEDCTTGVLYHKPQPLGNHVISHLRELGYSGGLIQTLNELKARFPIRFWLVDNSGSMLSQGGCEVRGAASEKPYVADCTRWVELKGTLQWHATLAGILENHTVFRLLNAPDQLPGMREFALADPSSDLLVEESVKRANEIIEKVGPRGFTPLTMHLERVLDSVQSIQHTLCDRGQQAVVVIATDGLPTDGTGEYTTESREKFETTLKLLQPLPVWLVFRLCTDDPDVMAYYNGLDRKVRACCRS